RSGLVGAIELRPSIYNRMRLSFNQSNVLEDVVQRQLLAENRFFGSSVDRLTSSWSKERKLTLVALEVENNFGNTRLDYQLSFSVNQEDLTDRLRHQFRGRPTQDPFSAAELAGISINDAVSNRPLSAFIRLQDNLAMEEDVAIGSLNLTRYLNESKNSFLRIGGRYRSKDRTFGRFSATLPWSSGTPEDIPAGSSPPLPVDVFPDVPDLTTDALAYALKQRIAAGYLMYAANFTSKLSASAGLRYEYIEVETAETSQDTFSFNRYDLLPSLNLTYRVRRDRQIRLSFHQALGRPNYATFRSQDDLILFPVDQYSIGNQDIRTTTSNNLDLTFERYGRRDDLITLGLYAKFLQNPTVRISETRFSFDRATYHTTLINTESANLVGAEFGFFQNLGFLGGDFRFFNVNGNYNFNALAANSRDLNFDSFTLPQAPRQTANLSIVCSNPNKGISLVIAANYRDRIFDRVLDGRPIYRNSLIALDFAADYEIIKGLSIYLRANNLTDHSFEEWFGEPNDDDALLRSQANYGSWGVIGVRFQPGKGQ
ncbi:MAG: TonB-dependent receptor, partial [Bacteroidota bacterium]